MHRWVPLAALFGPLLAAAGLIEQSPFLGEQERGAEGSSSDHYVLPWEVKEVAIIGAGVSGLLAYQALAETGRFSRIRIFERDSHPGGNWHYSDEVPAAVPIAKGRDSDWWKADYDPTPPEKLPAHARYGTRGNLTWTEELESERRAHRQPKPIWKSLKANTPAPQQEVSGFPWPPGVEWASPHWDVQRYLRSFASWLGLNSNDQSSEVSYNTRVETITERTIGGKHKGWKLVLRKLVEETNGTFVEEYWSEDFDAVVIATGRFHVPHIPAILGLEDWQRRFPKSIIHSRQYRSAQELKDRDVIVVGASASATGISSDINSIVKTSYLSIREHSDDPRAPVTRAVHLNSVPGNTTIIGEIKRFLPLQESATEISSGRIELINGTIVTGVDALIFGTGYRYAFPFLSQFHHGEGSRADHPVLVTDGSHVRSLYLDTFLIPQPTLAFQGLNVGIQTFTYGGYTAAAIARVWSGLARLPTQPKQWEWYRRTVEERGGLKSGYQWLNTAATARSLRHLVSWLSSEACEFGGQLLELPPDVSQVMHLWMRARQLGPDEPEPIGGGNDLWGENDITLNVIRDDW